MDSELARWVDDADGIRSSGRWAAVNAEISHLAGRHATEDAWYLQLFASLVSEVFSEYMLLKDAYSERKRRDAPLLAWRARNILELLIWSMYFSKNKDNARRLYEDAGRDALDIFSNFTAWGKTTNQPADWIDLFTSAKNDLSRRAESEGIETLDGHFKQVRAAAKECEIEYHFVIENKILSKFAHPTAMRILAAPDVARQEQQRDMFFSRGCHFFIGAFEALENMLNPINKGMFQGGAD